MLILERPREKSHSERGHYGVSSFSLTFPMDPAESVSKVNELSYGSPKGEHSRSSSFSSFSETSETWTDQDKGLILKKCKTF